MEYMSKKDEMFIIWINKNSENYVDDKSLRSNFKSYVDKIEGIKTIDKFILVYAYIKSIDKLRDISYYLDKDIVLFGDGANNIIDVEDYEFAKNIKVC